MRRSAQVVSLLTVSKEDRVRSKELVVRVEKALLRLPKLRLLMYPMDYDNKGSGALDHTQAVELIVGLHRAKWQSLSSQEDSVVYRRVWDLTGGN